MPTCDTETLLERASRMLADNRDETSHTMLALIRDQRDALAASQEQVRELTTVLLKIATLGAGNMLTASDAELFYVWASRSLVRQSEEARDE